jgi:hypothetical protein
MKVLVKNVRCAFISSLFEAESYEGSAPKHSGKFIIDPSDKANIQALDDAIAAVCKDKWGGKADNVRKQFAMTGKKPDVPFVRDAYRNRDGEAYDGFEDRYYLTASSKSRPLIIDRDRTPLVPSDGKPYAGCYVNAQVEIWAQDNSYGRAVRATLMGVQFVKDGDAFAGGASARVDDFEDLAMDDALA